MEQAPALPKFSLLPGWICLAVAILSTFLFGLLIGSFIAGPLIIAALVLSIIGMAKNNVIGGILLMLLTFILPPILYIALFIFSVIPAKKAHVIDWKGNSPIESTAP